MSIKHLPIYMSLRV